MNTSIEQQLAIYRRDRKRILRANYQRPLAMLGTEAQAFMETVWASQLNSRGGTMHAGDVTGVASQSSRVG